jgi:hypothetical protein
VTRPQRIQRKRAKGWRMPEGAIYVESCRNWILADARLIASIRLELAGRDLACWCPLDQPCHADVLLELANPAKTTEPVR